MPRIVGALLGRWPRSQVNVVVVTAVSAVTIVTAIVATTRNVVAAATLAIAKFKKSIRIDFIRSMDS